MRLAMLIALFRQLSWWCLLVDRVLQRQSYWFTFRRVSASLAW